MKKVILLSLLFSFLFSCSTVHIEKRRYRKGFHVSLNKHKSSAQEKSVSDSKANAMLTDEVVEVVQPASNEVIVSKNAKSTNKKRLQPIENVVKQKLRRLKQKEVKYINSKVFKGKTQSSFGRLESKVKRAKLDKKSELHELNSAKGKENDDEHIRSPFARVLLSFLTVMGALGGGLLVLGVSFIIAWNAYTLAGAVLSLIILAVGIYLVLFLSSLAFLNILRRESEIGVSLSKKAARKAFLFFGIIVLLIVLRMSIPWLIFMF